MSSPAALATRAWPGAERPAVLIHGVDGSAGGWEAVAAAVAERRRLIAIDLRGRGASSMDGPWGVAAHAADVVALLEKEAVDGPVTLVGHSFGGHVAARVAADRPDLVSDLVLLDGGPPRSIPEGTTPDALCDGALANIVPNLENKGYPVSAAAVDADFRSMVGDEVGARPLFAVTVPVRLFRAEHGVAPGLPVVVPDSIVDELMTAGIDLTEQLVAGATHFTIVFEPSDDVVAAIVG